ncbi:MAG: hypothetical protein ABSH34_31360, partial [Verrucomicrobiota bacterium]
MKRVKISMVLARSDDATSPQPELGQRPDSESHELDLKAASRSNRALRLSRIALRAPVPTLRDGGTLENHHSGGLL